MVEDLQELVRSGIQQNLPDSVIDKTAIPQAYKDWKFGSFYPYSLDFLCKQQRKSK